MNKILQIRLFVSILFCIFFAIVTANETDNLANTSETPKCEGELVHRAKIIQNYKSFTYDPEFSQRFYAPVTGRCLTKVDEPCPEHNATCAPNSQCLLLSMEGILLYRRCFCNGSISGVHNGFVANNDKTSCAPQVHHGQSCSNESPHVMCNNRQRLSCNSNNKCECVQPDKMWFDERAGKCRSLDGGPCEDTSDCDANSNCGWNKECKCNNGHNDNGRCYMAYGMRCSTMQECNSDRGMLCVDGYCQCEDPASQIYDTDDRICLSIVGTACSQQNNPVCVAKADCVGNLCKCWEGYSQTPARFCVANTLDYDQSCIEYEACDSNKGLACIDGKCKCIGKSLKYNREIKKCVSNLGSKCGVFGGGSCQDGECPVYFLSCEPPSRCLQFPSKDWICS